MRVLITGGSGFIGTALAEALLARGDRVVILTRRSAGRLRRPARIWTETLEAVEAPQTVDAVVNLAGENLAARRWSAARKQRFRDSRIDGTRRLVDWIAAGQARPRVLVSGSAIGWYGERGDERLDEGSAPGSGFSADLCRDWEAQAQAAEALGLRVCRLRTGIVLDRGGGALARMLPAFRFGLGGRMGSGRHWMSWVLREDLVRLILWLLDRDSASGAYNGTAPEPVRNAEFTRLLAAALHRPALLPMPAAALHLLFGEMAELLLVSQRVLPGRALEQGFVFHAPTLPAALERLLA